MDDPKKMMENCVMNVCQPGNALKCAGYVLYSSASIFVLTIGDGAPSSLLQRVALLYR